MKKSTTNKVASACLGALLLLSGCASANPVGETANEQEPTSAESQAVTPVEGAISDDALLAADENQESHFDTSDLVYDDEDLVTISLDGASVSVDSDAVEVDETTVTITEAGVYALSGVFDDGSVVLDVSDQDDVIILFDGVSIANSDGAAFSVMEADTASLILVDGTVNELADGASYTFPDGETDEPNAALFSATDLTIAGSGELIVTGQYNDGIASKDGLVIESGIITVSAVDDGIRGKDYVIVEDGTITVDAGGDAVKADNEDDDDRGYVQLNGGQLDLVAGDDGIQAATDIIVVDGLLTIDAGAISGTGRALQGDSLVAIDDGTIELSSVDDAIHANDTVTIDGGVLTITSGDDGIHGDLVVVINGGTITVEQSYEGIESEVITINDGTIDITSNDDGLNVASSEATTTTDAAADPTSARGNRGQGGPGGAEEVGEHYIYINGGTIEITITGTLDEQGDGIDANGHVEMTGGFVSVSGPTDTRNSALDYSGGTFVLTGGTIIGTNIDGRNSEGVGTGSTQASVYVSAPAVIGSGTAVEVRATSGEILITFEPVNDYSVIVFSSPDLQEGESYELYLDGQLSGSATAFVSA